MAKSAVKPEAANPIAPLFSDIAPPVHADDIGEIRVFRSVLKGSATKQGKQVDFGADEFLEVTDGEEFEPNPFETTEIELCRVLTAARPGLYWAQGYDKNGTIIQRAGRTIDATLDEPEEPDPDQQPAPAANGDLATTLVPAIIGILSKRQNEAASAPAIAAQMASVMLQKTPDSAIIEELRTELRSVRTKAEEEISAARRKSDREIDEARGEYRKKIEDLSDQLRNERATAQRREDEARADLREMRNKTDADLRLMREKADAELVAYRNQATQQIYQLQQQNLDLQQRFSGESLTKQQRLLETEFEKKLTERDLLDAQRAIAQMDNAREEELKNAAGAAVEDEMPGWLKPLMPLIKPMIPMGIEWLKANGKAVPKQLQQMQDGEEQRVEQPVVQQPAQPQQPAPPAEQQQVQPPIIVRPAVPLEPAVRQSAPRIPVPPVAEELPSGEGDETEEEPEEADEQGEEDEGSEQE